MMSYISFHLRERKSLSTTKKNFFYRIDKLIVYTININFRKIEQSSKEEHYTNKQGKQSPGIIIRDVGLGKLPLGAFKRSIASKFIA